MGAGKNTLPSFIMAVESGVKMPASVITALVSSLSVAPLASRIVAGGVAGAATTGVGTTYAVTGAAATAGTGLAAAI